LEAAKVPDRLIVLPELPRTANQKVDRKALRALLEEGGA
jgi:acyl-coenzyme A synthetase/AMP-(fatty) acid ligase